MLYTVTNTGLQNGRPTSIGRNFISIDSGTSYQYSLADFTTGTEPQYSDPEGDALAYIKILSLPATGGLYLNGVSVNINDVIDAGNVSTGNFVYQSIAGPYVSAYSFDLADVGSNSLSGLGAGYMSMNVTSVKNLPPSQIGDLSILVSYGDTVTFTPESFTSYTTPVYLDPEGDAPSRLKILDLPASGLLVFNGTNVVANQIIDFTEIALEYLVYYPDASITTFQSLEFNFAVSDAGSGSFSQ